MFIAFTVIAATLLDPFQTAIEVVGFVSVVLVEAGVYARLACCLLEYFGDTAVGNMALPTATGTAVALAPR